MDAVGGGFLVALPGIAGDADRADDFALGIADQQAARLGKQLLVARRDQIAHEDRPLFGALMHQARAAPKRERRIGFAECHLETDHRRAILLLEGFHLAARLDHDHADRTAVELDTARDSGVDDAVGLRHCDRSHGRKLIGNPSGAVLCHLLRQPAIGRTLRTCGGDMSKAEKAALIAWTAFLFVLMNLSRTARSAAAFGGRRSLTSSSTRTTSIQAIKAAIRSVWDMSRSHRSAPLPLPPPRQRATCAPMHAPAPPIAIERLVKIYKTVPAVDGISFTLTPGSVTGLLRRNRRGQNH